MSIKKILGLSLIGGFMIGLGLVGMGLMAADTCNWYNKVNAVEHTRAVLVDYTSYDTVTIVDFIGTAVKLTREP